MSLEYSVEIDGEEPVRALEPLQLHFTSLEEVDAGASDEIVHHVGHQHLAAEGLARYARRAMHGGAEDVGGPAQCVTGVNSDPDADRGRAIGERTGDLVLDRLRALERAAHAREGEHRSVALGLDDGATLCSGRLLNHGVMPPEEIEPGLVTEARDQDG